MKTNLPTLFVPDLQPPALNVVIVFMPLITFTENGIYCPQADVYIDPWRPVPKALITHAHADHSRYGMGKYLAHHHSIPVMQHRLGEIVAEGTGYGEKVQINGVDISFHPAGHIPGSSQIRLAYKGEVWVISGDYKLADDGFCAPFETVKCNHFVTESTFGLPVYKWKSQVETMQEINAWWADNKTNGLTTVILGYALGKAQRILANLDTSIGEIFLHGAIYNSNLALEKAGYVFPETERITPETDKKRYKGSIVIAPPSAMGSPWIRQFKPYQVGTASGWMALRGPRRRRNADRGFILSDHADWAELNTAVKSTGAEHIYVTHGYTSVYSKWLKSQGLDAHIVQTEFEGELSEIGESATKETDPE